ncbi:MAG: bifunctional methylenetetrahydrofolate dehydrogenase/methenyltetrahydrofolate cyclohydrolase [Clostridia bacterium]|nr:bifunctional methylenetetrahydrofolate dehydrogenase/methenyltetrahydrofolate cyclohydrolase [Clostridia bacterium]
MGKIINGRKVAKDVLNRVKEQTAFLKERGISPCLAVIIVGEDPASLVYVKNKQAACEKVGIISRRFSLPESTTEEELILLIKKLNADSSVHGILCQLPLPRHINEKSILRAIDEGKDVDGFSARIGFDRNDIAPCTPQGVIELLASENIDIKGKNCVVLGRSNIVGKPMALLLLLNDGTVTVCHSKTKNLIDITRRADILVVAIGKPRFITGDMVKNGVTVIDVGINRNADGSLCGDVDFDSVEPKAEYITKVPGGVGPMTIAMLMQNTIVAAMRSNAQN